MADVLRLGFAGLGEATTRVLPEIAQPPHIKIAGAADMRKNALEKFRQEFGGQGFDSIEGPTARAASKRAAPPAAVGRIGR
jgi:phthalate 4,5-cis-dihydrodiol dehydrogenase